MPNIHKLDKDLIERIAAGEVIERPVSVVKELIENALDANATQIKLDLIDGGKTQIKIQDNGDGIHFSDLPNAIERHATSKIISTDDLYNINTLGFRGEALASISAISRIKITTKHKDEEIGGQLTAHESNIKRHEKTAANQGTTIEVQDLFFNLPARKKHLAGSQTELTHIQKLLTRYVVCFPEVAFILKNNNKELLNAPATQNPKDNLYHVLPRDEVKHLKEINFEDKQNNIQVKGFISEPEFSLPNRSHQMIFINNRIVESKEVTDAIYEALHTHLPLHRHPVILLHINLPPKQLDQNIHPQKKRVSFENKSLLKSTIQTAVTQLISESAKIHQPNIPDNFTQPNQIIQKDESEYNPYPISKGNGDKETQNLPEESQEAHQNHYQQQNTNENNQDTQKNQQQNSPKPQNIPIQKENQTFLAEPTTTYTSEPTKLKSQNHFKVLGQIKKTYIILDSPKGLYIVDQHAAEERVHYEQFMQEFQNKDIPKQSLMQPQIIQIPKEDTTFLNENLSFFHNVGYQIEHFGDNEFLLRSYPIVLGKTFDQHTFKDILAELQTGKNLFSQKQEEAIIMKSCKASIKANQYFDTPILTKLIERLFNCNQPYTCPHGRPTMINLDDNALEKLFKRKI